MPGFVPCDSRKVGAPSKQQDRGSRDGELNGDYNGCAVETAGGVNARDSGAESESNRRESWKRKDRNWRP
jgi:hypothetical protein